MPTDSSPPTELLIDVFASACPSRETFEDVTGKWATLVLVALATEQRRFGELRRKVEGVSEKMLSQTLRSLERDGLVTRVSHHTVPPRVDYSLTALGAHVAQPMRALVDVLESSVEQVTAARAEYDARS